MGLKFRRGVVGGFRLRVPYEVTVKLLAKAAVISRLDWGCELCFGLFHGAVDRRAGFQLETSVPCRRDLCIGLRMRWLVPPE